MIERKIVITSCYECPFKEYVPSTIYRDSYYTCLKFGISMSYEEAYDEEKTHTDCMLPVNIESKDLK